ncbi:recombinase family protein [Cytobacillus purgationiresistens]|uniref:DNA invertase Pin-like site-specific DNA recombinase n=1 Tax=Cytobacillus purgationiresistens TaxID=863449 RepID=A0ABU0AFE6_9BACI|nr:recombinase family protein [Cytobacillus purgationiresistens]MDQ0269981.1 DNA invertase Pin-like site-specific DNA recombinase [Cytobacillus purgationiresistens]
MTVGIYIRVSTEEQVKEGFSISAQREKLKAFCQVHDWTDFKFYVDEGISAKDMNRPQLQLMIEHVKHGLIDTVLVYRLDRLTRSVLDLYKLLDIFENHNCKFKSATEVYDTTTAMGRMFITLVAAMAQWERENLGERVRMGQIEKARQGKYSAKAPYGFDKDDNEKLIINADEKLVVLDMIEKVKQGFSIRQLANYLDNSGTPPIRGYKWHIRTVLDILHNPALYGAIKWIDEIIENAHEGVITKEEYNHLLLLLNERQNKKKRKVNSFFVYQMKLICPICNNHLTSERSVYHRKRDNQLIESNRYRCQVCALNKRKAINVSESKIEKAFIQYMRNTTFNQTPELKDESQEEKEKILSKISRIKKQREKFQKAWSNDLMTDMEFADRMNETSKGLLDLEKDLIEIQPNKSKLDYEKVKELTKTFNLNWLNLKPLEKHQFLNMFIKNIHFVKDGSSVDVTEVSYY